MALPLVGLGAGILAKLFTFETLKYLAWRAFLIALALGIGPLVIFKGYVLIMKFTMPYAMDMLGSLMNQVNVEAQSVELYSVGAWMGSCLKVGEGISVYLSFLLLKFLWAFVPKGLGR